MTKIAKQTFQTSLQHIHLVDYGNTESNIQHTHWVDCGNTESNMKLNLLTLSLKTEGVISVTADNTLF